MTGRICLVATPIGNLSDISHRAEEVLASAAVIACEDTRRCGSLLRHLGIDRPKFVVLNDHTERDVAHHLVARAAAGDLVAVTSDAGMPGISDPGYVLVGVAIEAGVDVEVVPGASALLAALVLSGLATDRFVFEGFLPRKGAERSVRLADVARERRTVVLYEAPHRVARTIADLAEACGGDRRVAIARELTKLHEEVWRGTLDEAVHRLAEREPRGEIVLVVEGAPVPSTSPDDVEAVVRGALDRGATVREAADEAASLLGIRRNAAYEVAVRLRSGA